jgi:hypothetical protein
VICGFDFWKLEVRREPWTREKGDVKKGEVDGQKQKEK